MRDAREHAFMCWRRAISVARGGAGGGEGRRWNLPYGRQSDKRRNSREEKSKEKKVEMLLPTSTHLNLCAGPRDADRTLLLIHSPSSTSSPIFCTRSLFALVVLTDLSHHLPIGWPCVCIVRYDVLLSLLLIGIYTLCFIPCWQQRIIGKTTTRHIISEQRWHSLPCESLQIMIRMLSLWYFYITPVPILIMVLYVDTRVGRKKHPNTLQEKIGWLARHQKQPI